MTPETAKQMLEQALTAVHRQAGLRLTLGEIDQVDNTGRRYDAVVHLPDRDVPIRVELKKWAQHANLGALIDQVNKLPQPGILIADFINPQLAEKLRAADVQFIDTAGNAFLNIPPTYVYIRGNRPANLELINAGRKTAFGRAFTATGLKVVYAFLLDPELVNAPYRDIAETAGVAVGTVGWVINDLKADRYIADLGRRRGRRLIEYRGLLDRWTEAYPEKLRPKQMIGVYEAPNDNWWKGIDIRDFHAFWGGEIAGAKLTDFLTPQVATIYLGEGEETNLIVALKLRAARRRDFGQETGLTYLYRAFWPHTETRNELVDPVLAYADLIATADPRNREAANLILENHIANRIERD